MSALPRNSRVHAIHGTVARTSRSIAFSTRLVHQLFEHDAHSRNVPQRSVQNLQQKTQQCTTPPIIISSEMIIKGECTERPPFSAFSTAPQQQDGKRSVRTEEERRRKAVSPSTAVEQSAHECRAHTHIVERDNVVRVFMPVRLFPLFSFFSFSFSTQVKVKRCSKNKTN